MTARKVVYKVLLDIEKNKNYSNISLNRHLKDSGLEAKDRGLVTEIVYGVVANQKFIDHIINKKSKIKVKKMNHSVKVVLRMGVYQLIYLDKIGPYAAIDESVSIIKRVNKSSTGFVNAILREVDRQKDTLVKIDTEKVEDIAIKYSYEKWIVERLLGQYGKDRTITILEALSQRPSIYVRINRTKLASGQKFSELKKQITKELKDQGIGVKESWLVEEALELENFKKIETNSLFKRGYMSVQDISSMMVARAMMPEKNSKVLDLCSAPGGKTSHLAELMNNTGLVVAHDVYDHKIDLIWSYTKRLGLKNVRASKEDAMKLRDDYMDSFDYVLCDVPCSGMGIIRRKPEIKYKKEEDVNNLKNIQIKILDNAKHYVKRGGILLYSTCTIFREENEDIISGFLKKNENFVLDEIKNMPFDDERSKKGYINILPDADKMDGFFICRMKKI